MTKKYARIERLHKKQFKKKDLPKGTESRQLHADFLSINWDVCAASAWYCYQQVGRCVVIVPAELGRERIPWEEGDCPVMVGSGSDFLDFYKQELGIDAMYQDVKRMVSQYDPETQVVAIFIRLDGGISVYRVGFPHLIPPEAYKQIGSQLGEFMLSDAQFDEIVKERLKKK